jgi:hypothetical protein
MPTADRFTFIANDYSLSGLNKTDVSGKDAWTTLSGFNKNDLPRTPTESEINESLRLSWKLFLLNYSCSLTASATDTLFPNAVISGINVDNDLIANTIADPQKRLLYQTSGSSKVVNNTFNIVEANFFGNRPRRLYNGDITNEANFVGYGSGGAATFATSQAGNSRCLLRSFVTTYQVNDPPVKKFSYAYVNFGGFHFVCETWAISGQFEATLTSNASSLTSGISYSVDDQEGNLRTIETRTSINSASFYTL